MALVSLSVISIFKCKCHYRSHVLRDNGEDDGQQITANITPLGEFYVFVLLCISYAVSALSVMAVSDTSQTTPV